MPGWFRAGEKICKRIYGRSSIGFSSLFLEDDSKPEMIATFLAVLEMIKANKLFAYYNDKNNDFELTVHKRAEVEFEGDIDE